MTNVSDGVALVTGGAGGLGFALARALAQEGACPVIADIHAEAADRRYVMVNAQSRHELEAISAAAPAGHHHKGRISKLRRMQDER